MVLSSRKALNTKPQSPERSFLIPLLLSENSFLVALADSIVLLCSETIKCWNSSGLEFPLKGRDFFPLQEDFGELRRSRTPVGPSMARSSPAHPSFRPSNPTALFDITTGDPQPNMAKTGFMIVPPPPQVYSLPISLNSAKGPTVKLVFKSYSKEPFWLLPLPHPHMQSTSNSCPFLLQKASQADISVPFPLTSVPARAT